MNSSNGRKEKFQRAREVCKILFWKNKVAASLIYTSLLINALVWLGLYLLINGEHSILIWHYNVFFGVDVLINTTNNNSWKLFLPTIGGLVFVIINVLMSIFFILQLDRTVTKENNIEGVFVSNKALSFISSRLLLIAAWLVQLMLLVYLITIWQINN